LQIYFTTDGTEPKTTCVKYGQPFFLESKEIKAVAVSNNKTGSIATKRFGIVQKSWKVAATDSDDGKNRSALALDANPKTFWQSENTGVAHFMEIDLGKSYELGGFAYTPQTQNAKGMLEGGIIKVSNDGTTWQEAGQFQFGNLINDPTTRQFAFKNPVRARFVKIESTAIAGDDNALAIAEIDFFEK
jgi:alpha-L-fucosidase